MADVNPDLVRCRCGKDWDRTQLAQCPVDGSDLWEITTATSAAPEFVPLDGAPRTSLDPIGEASAGVELSTCGDLFRVGPDTPLALGRDESYPTADTFRAHTNVSRFHAVVVYENGGLFITDTSSANGTFINDHRIPRDVKYEIKPGQRLRLAADVPIVVRWNA